MNPNYRTALVTGATSGIGFAIANQLAEMGMEVYALGRSQTAIELLESVDGIKPLVVDVTDQENVERALKNLEIDVFVNNAGVMPLPKPFYLVDQNDIEGVLEVNVNAVFALTRTILPQMVERQFGHIFFTGSIAGHAAFPNMALYSACKAAVGSLAASLRCDLAGKGVRVTEIVPGRVKTSLYEQALGKEAAEDLYKGALPVDPKDVARMLQVVLEMPQHVDISRFDILPTAQYVGGGAMIEEKK
ncbi:MAG: SDR family NAD(P)-dependent oxidoreductase [Gammaproteobacteria bacterium]|nr:SDR family NAD(P)-dependent oxidoreductase [Gammaproteobacteria bacterium]